MFPWFVLTFKKFEALWYCQSIEMFFWVWECLNFQSIFPKFETAAINQTKSLVEIEYIYTIYYKRDVKVYIVAAAVSEVSIVQYLWLLLEGGPISEPLYWQTVCHKNEGEKCHKKVPQSKAATKSKGEKCHKWFARISAIQ